MKLPPHIQKIKRAKLPTPAPVPAPQQKQPQPPIDPRLPVEKDDDFAGYT